jgi:alanine dehydrogenase
LPAPRPIVASTHDGAQHEAALGSRHLGLGLQPADERVETGSTWTVDDDRVVERPRDVDRKRNLVTVGKQLLEVRRVHSGRKAGIDDGPHVAAECDGVDVGADATDHAAILQTADPLGYRTGREVHGVGEVLPADSAIDPQEVDDSTVKSVNHHGIIGHGSDVSRHPHLNDGVDQRTMPSMSPAITTVGVPKEIKNNEYRVAMTPDGVREFERMGIDVFVETGAGEGASFRDDDYRAAGADIVPTAADAWSQQMVVKVKEPKAEEFQFLRPDLTLFTYLHLAAYPEVAHALVASKCTALAYETVQVDSGALPLLAPMSEVAGRLAPQMGAHYLERHNGGRGVLMGGAPGVQPAKVVVLGAGNVGWNSAWIAAGMEAEVVLFDKNLDRLRWVDQINKGRIVTLASNRGALERNIADADLVIGAVLVVGGRAPVVVTEDMVRTMKPGAVIVDVAIDQGGCIETIRETTHEEPVYDLHGVIHYAVGNMPGAVPHTSTYALTNATLPYQFELARFGTAAALRRDPALAHGLNTLGGQVTNAPVAEFLDCEFVEPLVAVG